VFEDTARAVPFKTFVWNGIEWTLPLMASRLIWPALAMLLVALAVLFFDRFEQAPKKFKKIKNREDVIVPAIVTQPKLAFGSTVSYRSILAVRRSASLIPLILAELKLNLKELKPVWYLIGLGLIAGELFAPFDISRKYLVPAAMIWPLVLWSSMGTRETRFNMRSLLFCSAGVHTRQYVALLLSGVAIAAAMCMPMIVRSAITGEYQYLLLLVSSACLLPATAFALGTLTGSRKLFEVIYLMIWYGGSIDRIKPIDLLGTTDESTGPVRIAVFFAATLLAALTAYLARRKMADS